jgi:hypothetical protein
MPGEHAKNLLRTGLPGCGKTTAIRHPIERLADLRRCLFVDSRGREVENPFRNRPAISDHKAAGSPGAGRP